MRKGIVARSAVVVRCAVSIVALAAFAPCSDDDKSAVRMIESDSAALAAAAATGTVVPNDGNVRAVDYMVRSDGYRDWTRAQRDRADAAVQATKLGSAVDDRLEGAINDARVDVPADAATLETRSSDEGAREYYIRDREGRFVRVTRP